MNLRPILAFYGRLAAYLLLLEFALFWGWSRWFWTPIQAHYMGAYVWSSLPGTGPASGIRVSWIWKTAPGGKRELAIEDDAVRVTTSEQDKTGMRLSPSAREAGWAGLVEGFPERIPSLKLNSILCGQIFEEQRVWLFVLLPGLVGFVAATFLLQCFIWLEEWLPELPRRQRFPWESPAPTLIERWAVRMASIPSLAVRWCRAAIHGARKRPAVSVPCAIDNKAPVKPASVTFSPFGVHNVSPARVYRWSEEDEID